MCKTKEDEVIVPNKIADCMWHTHMQDNSGYFIDMKHLTGKVPNHQDQYSQEEMDGFWNQTQKFRKELFPEKMFNRHAQKGIYGGFGFIAYGPGICGTQEKEKVNIKVLRK